MSDLFWVNDELVRAGDARVSVLDHGFTVGDGVFETIKVVDGQTFARTLHLDRLDRSCVGIGLAAPDRTLVVKAIDEVLSAGDFQGLGRIRVTVTSGVGPLGSDRSSTQQTLIVAGTQQKPWSEAASVAVVPWVRNERSATSGYKTTSYVENVIALEAAHQAGCSEAIFLDTRGYVSEGTGSNIFWIKDSIVYTPASSTGLLRGITRELVMELCTRIKVDLRESEYPLASLLGSDEIFITSSTRDVMPVTEVKTLDHVASLSSSVTFQSGPVTNQLIGEFAAMSSAIPDPRIGEFSL